MNKRIIYIFCLLLFNYSLQGSAGSGALSSTPQNKTISQQVTTGVSQAKGIMSKSMQSLGKNNILFGSKSFQGPIDQQVQYIAESIHKTAKVVSDNYIHALKEGLPLSGLDRELSSLNANDQDMIKKEIRHVIETEDLKTAVLPDWLANDYENYTDSLAKQMTNAQHYSAMADHVAKKMEGYRFLPKDINKYAPEAKLKIMRRRGQLVEMIDSTQDFIILTPDNAEDVIRKINLDPKTAKGKDLPPITHVSVHIKTFQYYDIEALRYHLMEILKQHPELILIVNFDNDYDTFYQSGIDLPDNIKHLIVAGRNITTIGDYFLSHKELTSLELPAGITTIGNGFLHKCADLTNLQLPAGITTVGDNFLEGCTGLTNLKLPAGLTKVGNWFLKGCTGLISLKLPAGITTIGNGFLHHCNSLTSLQLPASLTTVGDLFLEGCTGLTNLKLPADLTKVGNWFLKGCTGLISLKLPAGITTIGNGFLHHCNSLTSLQLPAGLTTAGDYFLYNCTNLTDLELPARLTTVGDWFLKGCTGLISLQLPAELTTVGDLFLESCTGLTSLQLPESLTTVGDWFLKGCTGLTNLQLPAGLATVGDLFLESCTGLTSLQLSASLTTVGDWFLEGCTGLTSLQLPAGLTTVGSWFLKGCTGLTSITLGEKLYEAKKHYLRDKMFFPKIERIDIIKQS